jgi:hypothetical protein
MQAIDPDSRGSFSSSMKAPALISTLLVLPFLILELVNHHGFNEGFPAALFALLWLLPLAFILLLLPIVRQRSPGPKTSANRLRLWSRIAVMGFIVWAWVSLVVDQMPCFLGIPNCD